MIRIPKQANYMIRYLSEKNEAKQKGKFATIAEYFEEGFTIQ